MRHRRRRCPKHRGRPTPYDSAVKGLSRGCLTRPGANQRAVVAPFVLTAVTNALFRSPCAQQSAIIDEGAVNSFWRRSYQRPTSAGGGLHGAIVDEGAVSTPLLLAALP